MRILYVTPAFHHPTMRGPTRCYHFTRELSKHHEITLLSLTEEEITPEARDEMQGYVESIVTVQMNGETSRAAARMAGHAPVVGRHVKALLDRRDAAYRMRGEFERLVEDGRYDVVLFHGKVVGSILDGFDRLPVVVDFCDATTMRLRSTMRHSSPSRLPVLGLRYLQMLGIERRLLRRSRHVAFVSHRDREAIVPSSGPPEAGAEVVSIGVDQSFWRRRLWPTPSNELVFAGIMSYGPNEDAARVLIDRILPLVKRSVPDARVVIVGRDPSASLCRRAESDPSVTVTGFVDDVRPYLENASLATVPLRYGAGVQNKVLEAMAMEVPVVTTPMVAEGLQVDGEGGVPVKVAARERDFAEAIVKLLARDDERARLAAQGRRFVEQNYDWAHSARKLERMCEQAVCEWSEERVA